MRPVPPSPHAHPTAWPAGHPLSRHSSLESRRVAAHPRRTAWGRPCVPSRPHPTPTPPRDLGHLDSSLSWAGWNPDVRGSAHRGAAAHRGRPCVPSRPHPTPTPPRGLPATWIPAFAGMTGVGWNPDVRGSAHRGAAAHRGRPCVPSRPHPTPTPPRGLPATWIPAFAGMIPAEWAGIQTCAAAHTAAQPRIGAAHASRPALTPRPPPPRGLPATWIPAFAGMTGVGAGMTGVGWNPDVRGSAHRGAAAHRGRPCVPSPPSPHAHPTAWPAGHLDSSLRWNDGCGRWNDGCGLESRRARQRTPRPRRSRGLPAHRGRPCVPSRPHPTPTPHRVACRPPGFQPSLE